MKKYNIHLVLLSILCCFASLYSKSALNTERSAQEVKNGIELFNERKYVAAIQAFESALVYEPLNYFAKYRLGLAFLHAGYAQNAVRIWEELVQAGVADNYVVDKLNSLYLFLSRDEYYNFQDPYIFRQYYDGYTDGLHNIFKPSFLTYDKESDRKFISSSVGSVIELDSGNKIIRKYGPQMFRFNTLKMPMGTSVYNNQLYVADFKLNKIFVFNRDITATLAYSFGESGFLSNQIFGPMGLEVYDGYVYVVDNGNARIQKFMTNGTYVSTIGENLLFRPTDIVIQDGQIFVTDIAQNFKGRVLQFDNDGNFVKSIGEDFLRQPRGLFLNNNQLYISDLSGSLYIYDLQSQTSRSFSANDDKIIQPFDLIKDKDQIIWRSDFNNQNLGIYVPLQAVYGNIILDVSQILTEEFPYMYIVVRARQRDGSPLVELDRKEFELLEFDKTVSKIAVSKGSNRSNLLTHLVIDRSKSAERFLPQLEYYVKTFLSNSSATDRIQVSLIDDQIYTSAQLPANLSVWSFITNHQPISQLPVEWDTALYNAVTGLFNNLRNRSVVVFSSGEASDRAFATYGPDVLETYANQNNIPFYVINFSQKNMDLWRNLALKSHGQYFSSQDSKRILDLYSTIKNSPPLEYLIEYTAFRYPNIKDFWIDITLKFQRFGISGTAFSGYYIPSLSTKKFIDLNQDFFGTNNSTNSNNTKTVVN
ncbi:MAG: hypothetical protein ACRCTQ_04065 [Brevinemataceae bacterium]